MLVRRFTSIYDQIKASRWFVMVLLGLIIITFEASEHIFVGETIISSHFLTEVITYGIGIPAVGVILIIWLNRAEEQRDRVEFELGKIQEFNNKLRNASTWDGVVNNVVQFPKFVLPVTNTCLTIYDPEDRDFKPVASWTEAGDSQNGSCDQISLDVCQSCILALHSTDSSPHICSESITSNNKVDSRRYCLPLIYRNYMTGLLIFDTPSNVKVTNQEIDILKELAPELALTVDYARVNSKIKNQQDTVTVERQRIARDLHDTLGQNISFLRMKLDQMSYQDPLLSIAEFTSDLERMCLVANEAYDQMRGTLEELHPDSQIRLEEALRSQAEKAAERVGFEVSLETEGIPRRLQPHTNRQIQYICRETLNNIEKHANAEHVRIHLLWGEGDLTIKITDDGCGFDLNTSLRKQNFGLAIMSERTNDINAELNIESEPGTGSTVSLKVPLDMR